mmetsp:Transcript_19444/g.51568  ORF Transcript_19444/g.51568 Transcript_19444/m.51568 type:complete len:122 (-) Transcript_19444:84-449(-)
MPRSRSRRRSPSRKRRSSSSKSSRSPPRRPARGGGSFGGGPAGGAREPVVKVGPYKEIEDEENRRRASGEPPLSIIEKDGIFRNFTRKQQGLPPIDITKQIQPDKGKGGKDKGKGKGKGKW